MLKRSVFLMILGITTVAWASDAGSSSAWSVLGNNETKVEYHTQQSGCLDTHMHMDEQVRQALVKLGLCTISAATLLSNSFGRIGLIMFLSYKTLKQLKKAYLNKKRRNEHLAKTTAYAVATGLLVHDGYHWLMKQEW